MDAEIDALTQEERPNIREEDLFKAAESGDSSVFGSLSREQLVKSLSLRNEDGRSLLHVAASSGHPEVVKLLSAADESKSIINSKDEEGWVPLHSASSIGNAELVEILLSTGADVNLKNDGGRTALHYAASKGWLKIAQLLISHGAKINSNDKVGCTPLHRAASTGKSDVCELLIEEGADIDATDKVGQTPLMHSVICCNKEGLTDGSTQTVISTLSALLDKDVTNNQTVALLLIRHGADVDVEDKEGYTVLGRAPDDFRSTLVDAAKAMLEG